jgi:hypothetical protein
LLKILSNNTILTEEEERKGETNMRGLKALTDKNVNGRSDKKRIDFIKRFFAVTDSPKTRQAGLLIKIADTINNISVAENRGKSPIKRIDTLRVVISRFITFITQDYKNPNYPLFNTVPDLIETALAAYSNLSAHHYKCLSEIDFQLIKRLYSLKLRFPKMPLPEKAQKVLDEYNEKRLIY